MNAIRLESLNLEEEHFFIYFISFQLQEYFNDFFRADNLVSGAIFPIILILLEVLLNLKVLQFHVIHHFINVTS